MKLLTVLSLLAIFSLGAASRAESRSEFNRLRSNITKMIIRTHERQTIMGYRATPTRLLYKHRKKLFVLRRDFKWWNVKAGQYYRMFLSVPNKSAWLCIHRYEGSWTDTDDPFWGGLQMDRGFMSTYAPRLLLRKGFANAWKPLEQMWVAERARRSGRGFYPWPNTARYCGLI